MKIFGLNKFVQLHLIIFLWGWTPVLGKLISLQALPLVWWRLFISGIALFAFAWYKGVRFNLKIKDWLILLGWGFIVGAHWYFFYHAIKVSNVSIALAGFSTITLFASVLQPLLLKKKFFWGDAIYGVIIAAGILVILQFEQFYAWGIFYGMLAAITAAMFGVNNGKLITRLPSMQITTIEFLGAFIFITIFMGINQTLSDITMPAVSDGIYLLILSLLCTVLAFTWSVEILKQIDPLTVIITNNLEPIYGVIFSVILFGQSEIMSNGFYLGASILLLSVFSYPLVKRKFYKG